MSLNWKIKCEQFRVMGKIQAANPNPRFILIFGMCETLRKSPGDLNFVGKLDDCPVGIGWRKRDLWFLHNSGTHKDCIFSSCRNNKMSWLPKPLWFSAQLMDNFFCLSRVGRLLPADVIWEEAKVYGSEWLPFQLFLVSESLCFLRSTDGGRGERESFFTVWIASEEKGW